MEPVTEQKIKETVLGILKSADLKEMTEFKVRQAATERLGIDLSDAEHKLFIRNVLESFLLSSFAETEKGNKADSIAQEETRGQQDQKRKPVNHNGGRFICQLSGKRKVTIEEYKGKVFVSIREYYNKAGKIHPSTKGIHLTPEQWTTFRHYIPAVEEAVTKMQLKLSLEQSGDQKEDRSISATPSLKLVPTVSGGQKEEMSISATPTLELVPTVSGGQKEEMSISTTPTLELVPTVSGGQKEEMSISATATLELVPTVSGAQKEEMSISATPTLGLVPTEPGDPERFNGRNYLSWALQMESFLNQLKIAYVLSEPCPRVTLGPQASVEETAGSKAAELKWVNDDRLCRCHILNFLSDQLYYKYSKESKSSKELWEGLKLIYLYEEFGTKRAQVKNYIEFQMVDEKSVLEQVEELNNIADSVIAASMPIEENFHVSVIISKLPPSWKDFSIKLMREEHLSFNILMDHIKAEEKSRCQRRLGEPFKVGDYHLPRNCGPRIKETRKPGTSWKRGESDVDGKNVICYHCKRKGHISQNCRYRKFDKESNEKKADDSDAPRKQDQRALD